MAHRINWDKEMLPIIREQLYQLSQQGITPTLRGMYYRLYSLGVFRNLKNPYKQLSDYTAKLRKRSVSRYSEHGPTLPIDCFADDTRGVYRDWEDYQKPDYYIKDIYDMLDQFPETYPNTIPRWRNQPHYVEIWIEKRALRSTISNILDDRQVRIVAMSGYASVPFMHDNMTRLENQINAGKVVHILYGGDLDPTGEDIYNNIINYLEEYDLTDGVDINKFGVTDSQRERYNLPISLDTRTKAKLGRDPRVNSFRRRRQGAEAYQVELDALPTIVPDEFKEIILRPIDKWFDEEIYKEIMNKEEHREKSLKKLQMEMIQKLHNKYF